MRFAHISKYYADDKDIYDLLSSPNLPLKRILQVARERGLFLSDETPREEVINYVSRLPFNWQQLEGLISSIEKDDRAEKKSTLLVQAKGGPSADLSRIAGEIREARGELHGEVYSITTDPDGRTLIAVRYTELDALKTRTLQRREKELQIEVEQRDKEVSFRYDSNPRAEFIMDELVQRLSPPDTEPLKKCTVELCGIRDHEKRIQFFVDLMRGIEGFRLRDVKDLKVERFSAVAEAEEETEEGADAGERAKRRETERKKDEMKGIVRHMALSGESLLTSPQYNQLKQDGFFISKSIWDSFETNGKGRVFEFEAEFKDPQEGRGFCYTVRGVYDRDNDGELKSTRRAVLGSDKHDLLRRLEDAAFTAANTVTKDK